MAARHRPGGADPGVGGLGGNRGSRLIRPVPNRPALYGDKVTEDLSSDPDDRVHAAAAMYGDVDVMLTRNLRHLRTKPVLAAGVKVITADEFLCALLADRRQDVAESLAHAADRKKNPPMTPRELAQKMSAAGAPLFAEYVRPHIGEIARHRAAKEDAGS